MIKLNPFKKIYRKSKKSINISLFIYHNINIFNPQIFNFSKNYILIKFILIKIILTISKIFIDIFL